MMDFFCPNCQKVVSEEPVGKVETKFKQIFFKAACAICKTDLAAKDTSNATTTQVNTVVSVSEDQVLKEFATTAN